MNIIVAATPEDAAEWFKRNAVHVGWVYYNWETPESVFNLQWPEAFVEDYVTAGGVALSDQAYNHLESLYEWAHEDEETWEAEGGYVGKHRAAEED